jgi:hypothetical protein
MIGSKLNFEAALETISGSTGHIKCNPRPVDAGILTEIIHRAMNPVEEG